MPRPAATRSWRAPPTASAACSPPAARSTAWATAGTSSTPSRWMWRSLALAAALVAASVAQAQDVEIPRTAGWELIMRCAICHSVEIAVQQRFGPQGWSETLDRMIKYGAPIPPEDKAQLMAYLLRHYRDPNGR